MIKIFVISLFLMVNIVPFNCNHSDGYIDYMIGNFENDGHENPHPLSLELQNG
jgi:hypothetical protein